MTRISRVAPLAVAGTLLALDLTLVSLLGYHSAGLASIDNAVELWIDREDSSTIDAYCLEQVEFGSDTPLMVNVWARNANPVALRHLSADLAAALLDIDGVRAVLPAHDLDILEIAPAGEHLRWPRVEEVYRDLNTRLRGAGRWAQHPALLSFVLREKEPAEADVFWRLALVKEIRDLLDARDDLLDASAGAGRPFAVVGTSVINADLNDLSWHDFRVLIPISSVVVVLLVFALLRVGWRFGAAVTASGSLATLAACSAMLLLGRPFNMLTIALPGVVFTLSVASGLHVLHHYCDLVARGGSADPARCAWRTTRDLLRPVSVSHVTTALGFGLQFGVPVLPVTTMAFWGAAGVLWAGLHSAFVTPQLLALIGPRPDAAQHSLFRGTDTLTAAAQRAAQRCATWRRRRWLVALSLTALATPIVAGVISLDVNSTYLRMVSENEPMRRDYAHLDAKDLASTQLSVIIERPSVTEPTPVGAALQAADDELLAARMGICRARLGIPVELPADPVNRLRAARNKLAQAGVSGNAIDRADRVLREAQETLGQPDVSVGDIDDLLRGARGTVRSSIRHTAVLDADFNNRLRTAGESIENLGPVTKVIGPTSMFDVAATVEGAEDTDDERRITRIYKSAADSYQEAGRYVNDSLERWRLVVMFEYLDNQALRSMISEIERSLAQSFAGIDRVSYDVAGVQVLWANMDRAIDRTFWPNIAQFTLACFIVFLVSTRRRRLAAVATVVNVLPMALIAAIMGFAGMPLDLATIFILGLTFGIAIDDTSFFVHRYLRAEPDGMMVAMRDTLRVTMPPMIATSMVIAAGFSVLLLSSFTPMQVFGSVTAMGIAFAALFDCVMLPLLIAVFASQKDARDDT